MLKQTKKKLIGRKVSIAVLVFAMLALAIIPSAVMGDSSSGGGAI
jgi:hypothetical protein